MRYPFLTRTLSLALALLAGNLHAQTEELVTATAEPELLNKSSAQETAKTYQRAQDLAYGATLYKYFQGDYFSALSTLLVAQKKDSIQVHWDNAAMIEGGISLGFGLHRRAGELFQQQLDTPAADTVPKYHQAAWLKLAELNYLNGDFATAAAQLEKSGAAQKSSLPLNLALRNNDFSTAQKLLEGTEITAEEQLLGHINFGAALARTGQFPAAVSEYQRAVELAGDIGEPSVQIPVLADKAHIGAGYALALAQQHTEAKQAFARVRLNTPWATRALLGMAWSSINNEDYQAGIDALQFLLNQHGRSPAAREAMVALPYGYEKLGKRNIALSAYQQSETFYQQTLGQLQQLQKALATEPLAYDPKVREVRRYGWLQLAQANPLLRDNQHFLQPILQSDHFQLRLTELRDLQQMSQVLQDWENKLPQLAELIEERHRRRTAIIERYNSAQFDQQLQMATQQYEQLNTALAQIETEHDALGLLATTVDPEQPNETLELLDILLSAEQRHQKLKQQGKDTPLQANTLSKSRGVLLWQANEQYHGKLWQQRKSLEQLAEQLLRSKEQRKDTDSEAQRAPQLRQLAYRIATVSEIVPVQQHAIDRASAQVEAALRREVIAQLDREQQQILGYMAHTRLAIARLQDAEMQQSAQPPISEAADVDSDALSGAAANE
ncbi:hypothetical protein MO867_00300 [Microbulbifer sp. OS29]|uniref:Tetratricopeptide repeat protein n=1 Tax=Microbulbifer okhotskensis TaxID=2926617 RepID=A0A9X2EKM1_9GAMM|nr:hypothetical protein [Microbulbifer okhotskensis]MCO1332765.1 hypothetical protein [Microbulbifer okhotskensis]